MGFLKKMLGADFGLPEIIKKKLDTYKEHCKCYVKGIDKANQHQMILVCTEKRLLFRDLTLPTTNNTMIDIPFTKFEIMDERGFVTTDGKCYKLLSNDMPEFINEVKRSTGRDVTPHQKRITERNAREARERYSHMRSSYSYANVCWSCKSEISSDTDKRCPKCRWYICSKCGSCGCNKIK